MNRYAATLIVIFPCACAFAASTPSFDWPQFQGPDRNSVSKETGLLKQWPAEGPPLLWEIKTLGGGYSAPAVTEGKIFGMSDRGDDEVVWCLSEADGKEIWVTKLGPAVHQGQPQGVQGPGATPTVDGDKLYVIGLGGDLVCLSVQDGKVVWRKSFVRDFGGRLPTWRFNESPLIDGDKVIGTPGGADATIVALDKLTGNTVWKAKVPGAGGAAYSSALAVDFDGQRQYVQFSQKTLFGVSAVDGKFLWKYDPPANHSGINISTAVYQDGEIFAASAYNAGGGLVKLTKQPDGGVKAQEVYFTKNMQNHHGGMIVVDGCLYGANGGNGGGYLVCLDFQTGKVLWDEGAGQRRAAKGSVALADGRIYYRTEKGAVMLIEPDPKQYVEHGRFQQPDRSAQPAWPHPVIANGRLYLRDQDVLLCYDVKAK
jgi:outer membrane protein assembly factor BamB